MSFLHFSDLVNESSDEVEECFFLPLFEFEKHCHQWPRAYISEEVELKLLYELSKRVDQEWLQASVPFLYWTS